MKFTNLLTKIQLIHIWEIDVSKEVSTINSIVLVIKPID